MHACARDADLARALPCLPASVLGKNKYQRNAREQEYAFARFDVDAGAPSPALADP
jgi:hypothetical protein